MIWKGLYLIAFSLIIGELLIYTLAKDYKINKKAAYILFEIPFIIGWILLPVITIAYGINLIMNNL
jgi:hypothetical protein